MGRDGGETMGQRLQRLRRAAGLTQAELAERAGVPLKSVLNWEQDRRQPRLDAAADLARLLGVTLEELLADLAPREQRRPARKGRPPAKEGGRGATGKRTPEPKLRAERPGRGASRGRRGRR
jgi:transcriptional regulator with XRE-family HTH domain